MSQKKVLKTNWRKRSYKNRILLAGFTFAFLSLLAVCQPFAKSKGMAWHDPYYPVRIPLEITVETPGQYQLELDSGSEVDDVKIDSDSDDESLKSALNVVITDLINKDQVFTFNPKYFAFDNVKLLEIKNGKEKPADAAFYIHIKNKELIKNGDFENVIEKMIEKETVIWPEGWGASTEAIVKEWFKLEKREESETKVNHYLSVVGADRTPCDQKIQTEKYTWYKFSFWVKGTGGINPLVNRVNIKGWQPIDHSWVDPFYSDQQWLGKSYYFYTGDRSGWKEDKVNVCIERFTKDVDNISMRECEVAFIINFKEKGTRRYYLYYAPVEGTTVAPPQKLMDAFPKKKLKVNAGRPQWLNKDAPFRITEARQGTLWSAKPTDKVLQDARPPVQQKGTVRFSCARNETEAIQLVFTPKENGKIEQVKATLEDSFGNSLSQSCFDIREARYVPIAEPSTYAVLGGVGPPRYTFDDEELPIKFPDPLPEFKPVAFEKNKNVLIWVDVTIPKNAASGIYKGQIDIFTDKEVLSVPLKAEVWDFALPDRPSCRTAFAFSQYANQHLFPFHKVESDIDKYHLSRAYVAEMAKYKISAKLPTAAGVWKPGLDIDRTLPSQPPEKVIEIYQSELSWALEELYATGYIIGHFSGPHMGGETLETAKKEADHFEPIAKFLDKNNWLDRAFIWIDEPRLEQYEGVYKWIEAFKTPLHARKIKIFPLVYNTHAYDKLKNHVDLLGVLDNESQSTLSPLGFSLLRKKQVEPWCYYTRSVTLWIDTPGINQRFWAPKNWAFGSRGIAIWGINQWWDIPNSVHHQENPWKNPLTTWGNGALAFFYPPGFEGKNITKKDMTITPSLRLLLIRDGIEDYEYGAILQKLVNRLRQKGMDAEEGEKALAMLKRPFINPQTWTLNDAYWQIARKKAAKVIVKLQKRLN